MSDPWCIGCGMPAPSDSDPICAECLSLPGGRRMLAARSNARGAAGATLGVAGTGSPPRVGDVLPLVEIRRLAGDLVAAIDAGDLIETDRLVRDLADDWSALAESQRSERNRRYLVTRAA